MKCQILKQVASSLTINAVYSPSAVCWGDCAGSLEIGDTSKGTIVEKNPNQPMLYGCRLGMRRFDAARSGRVRVRQVQNVDR